MGQVGGHRRRWGWLGRGVGAEPPSTVFIAHAPRRLLGVVSDRLEIIEEGNQLGFGLDLGQRERDNCRLIGEGRRSG